MEAKFNPSALVSDCRDMGNARFAAREYQKAEEAFALGLTIYEIYGGAESQTAGYGCLVGLADSLRAQHRDVEAEALIRKSRGQLRKIA
jgi:hypothetical protein